MSALQLQETGNRFVHAMGPMVDDENMMSAVFAYIAALRSNNAPCQYNAQQVREFAAKAESEFQQGTGMTRLGHVIRAEMSLVANVAPALSA